MVRIGSTEQFFLASHLLGPEIEGFSLTAFQVTGFLKDGRELGPSLVQAPRDD